MHVGGKRTFYRHHGLNPEETYTPDDFEQPTPLYDSYYQGGTPIKRRFEPNEPINR